MWTNRRFQDRRLKKVIYALKHVVYWKSRGSLLNVSESEIPRGGEPEFPINDVGLDDATLHDYGKSEWHLYA